MTVDKRKQIRELCFRRIIKARMLAPETESIWYFRSPKINFQVTDYPETIDWAIIAHPPPPFLQSVSDDEVWAKITACKTADEWIFGKFPCHTQAVERFVKVVTEASKKSRRCQESVEYNDHSSFNMKSEIFKCVAVHRIFPKCHGTPIQA